jgi:DNA-binding transcriptional ArsR family regulator
LLAADVARARVFSALGDETRLALVAGLCGGGVRSISELTELAGARGGKTMTRQAVTKHLRVLERAGLVRCARAGRERRFEFEPRRVEEMREYLEFVSAQWDGALGRLKDFVEG